ncbi:hypothetical protein F5X96DRAFT_647171 [Biscogniauxia mediterranea]|nr:hypothetical protein F5X96DRAFT_647171 [Biscogniauxia mediterranea]
MKESIYDVYDLMILMSGSKDLVKGLVKGLLYGTIVYILEITCGWISFMWDDRILFWDELGDTIISYFLLLSSSLFLIARRW